MILQILADAGKLMHHIDAMILEQIARPHAGHLQQLHGPDGARRENDLASGIDGRVFRSES